MLIADAYASNDCRSLSSQYPEGLGKYDYIPGFAIRGLHYDVQKVSCTKFTLLGFVFRCVVFSDILSLLAITLIAKPSVSPGTCARVLLAYQPFQGKVSFVFAWPLAEWDILAKTSGKQLWQFKVS